MKTSIQIFLTLALGILLTILSTTCKKDEQVRLSKIIIGSASNITETTATIGGEVIDIGDNATAYGHCWATTQSPTIEDKKKDKGGTVVKGNFITEITGLTPNTKYYVRAYVIEGTIAVYSSDMNFTTKILSSTVITTDATEVTGKSAKLNGTVNPNGESADVSFEWGTSTAYGNTLAAAPSTISGSEVTNVGANLKGLTKGTVFHFRVRAEKSGETSFGSDKYFTTNDIPTVTTEAITEPSYNSAKMGGNITSDGGSSILDKGVCWSITNNEPDINDKYKSMGTGKESFSQEIIDLIPDTIYYVRAYATNDVGTAYGNVQTFKTDTTQYITIISPKEGDHWLGLDAVNITWKSNIEGNVKIDLYKGDSTAPLAEVNANTENDGFEDWESVIDKQYGYDYKIRITSLDLNDIFAESEKFKISESTGTKGTVSGEYGGFFYGSKIYKTIKIGEQWWMAENLRERHYISSSGSLVLIPKIENDIEWSELADGDIACCDGNVKNLHSLDNAYGGLYTRAAAMNGASSTSLNPSGVRGICPEGWHLPSNSEWLQLFNFVGNDFDEVKIKLRSKGSDYWELAADIQDGTDVYQFDARGSGFCSPSNGAINNRKNLAIWWTTNKYFINVSDYQIIGYNYLFVNREPSSGFAIRCIKD